MAIEIERKFRIADDGWRAEVIRVTPIRQGYFSRTSLLRARIRIFGDQGFITFKSEADKGEPGRIVRDEYEYEIPKADAVEMITKFSIEPLITKRRHDVVHAGRLWLVDVYEGTNKGLVLAEVELSSVDEIVTLPPWVGDEVTDDRRYGNSSLARYPFLTWEDEATRSEWGLADA